MVVTFDGTDKAEKKACAEKMLLALIPYEIYDEHQYVSDANVEKFSFEYPTSFKMEFDLCQVSKEEQQEAADSFKTKFEKVLVEFGLDDSVTASIEFDVAFHHYDGITCKDFPSRRRRRSLLDDEEDVAMIVDASVPVNKATATPYSDDTLYERTWANANAIANYVHFVFHGDQAMAEASKYITEHAAVADHKLFHKA